jgi:hypothetical protein
MVVLSVLRRYQDNELPEFCEIPLDDVNQAGNFGDRLSHAKERGNDDIIGLLNWTSDDGSRIAAISRAP